MLVDHTHFCVIKHKIDLMRFIKPSHTERALFVNIEMIMCVNVVSGDLTCFFFFYLVLELSVT